MASFNWFDIIENKRIENKPKFMLLSVGDGGERKTLVLDNGEYEIKSSSSNALSSIFNLNNGKTFKKENVISMLNNVGINSSMKGHKYLVDLLLMVLNDGVEKSLERVVYPAISKRYNVATASVERCIRYAIGFMWKHVPPEYLEDYFGVNIVKKFTIKQFVEIACNKLKKKDLVKYESAVSSVKVRKMLRITKGK